ncbi:orexigenic neuropeptide QRFP [Ochotona curzoniae]|uniref:orexigenic neuropeptide QRFP n=1 Tax=Ochotona curzoniae TaxID=130825 RepID=UPI001B347E83|nr:orexigenic neuropeptide QRFP [Ochotona curzoniae]
MRGPCSLPYLLLLPLGVCFPLLDRRAPLDTVGSSWAALAEGPQPPLARSTWPWPRALVPLHTMPIITRGLWGREHAGFHFRFRLGRRHEDAEGDSGGEKAGGHSLGSLAEELGSYSRKKGGFSFRFGRR